MDFADLFKKYLGETGVNEFARLTGTSAASVSRAKTNGADVATENLETWARAFKLDAGQADEFIFLGLETEAMQDKKRGHLYRKLRNDMATLEKKLQEIEATSGALVVALDDPKNRLTKPALDTLRALVEALNLKNK